MLKSKKKTQVFTRDLALAYKKIVIYFDEMKYIGFDQQTLLIAEK